MDTRNNKFKLDFMSIGQDIKQAREAKDVTREQLSEVIDYAPRHIQAIENEGANPPAWIYCFSLPKCLTFLLTGTYSKTGIT